MLNENEILNHTVSPIFVLKTKKNFNFNSFELIRKRFRAGN